MGAPKKNQFWKARSKHGRDKIFKSPKQLWDACVEYFDWCEKNPIITYKPFSSDGKSWNHEVPVMRAMTIQGLCIFLDVTTETWNNYKKDKDFFGVITRAEEVMYNQKFTGASAGVLNANIIARDLGLKEQTENKHEVKDVTPPIKWDE